MRRANFDVEKVYGPGLVCEACRKWCGRSLSSSFEVSPEIIESRHQFRMDNHASKKRMLVCALFIVVFVNTVFLNYSIS